MPFGLMFKEMLKRAIRAQEIAFPRDLAACADSVKRAMERGSSHFATIPG